MPNGNGSPKGNPEGLGEMMKRVLHAVQLAVPIGIITRPNIAQRSNLCAISCLAASCLTQNKKFSF